MVLTRNQAESSARLLEAILSGDRSRLAAQLACASPAALAVTEPLSVFHAAALVGDAEVVRLLAAAGAPVAAADQPAAVWHLNKFPALFGAALSHAQRAAICIPASALGVAVRLEHADATAALLELGVAPDACPCDGITPLEVVAEGSALLAVGRGPPFGGQGAALVQQLLAAGADVTRCHSWSVYLCASRQPEAALILLSHLRLASQAGRSETHAGAHNNQFLLQAASMVDDVGTLEHFAGRLQPQHATQQLAHRVLQLAAATGSLQVVDLALRAAAGPDGQQTAAGRLLGPHVGAAMPGMMHAAAQADRTAVLQLLLAAGYAPDNQAFCGAVVGGRVNVLRLLLQQGPLPDPAAPPGGPLRLPSKYDVQYQCPILTALQTHHMHCGVQDRFPGRAAQPWDATILPVLELLLEAGYRPATYERVSVHVWLPGQGVQVELRQRFDPLAEDAGLIQAEINRWLALAIQHPAWSPPVHHRFLPSFQAAARALLLVARRGGRRRSSGTAAGLASLPQGVLLHIIGLAAYPLSAWVALDAGGPAE